ncbi:MAG: NUDIX domain-containing protein [Christensenellaceae bacterium]|nr:NUDIX domain-containing protein [Christensenellaceae bacterium]
MKHERSCGTVLFTMIDGRVHYLLIRSRINGSCGFPKGHIERGETEMQTALRETWEETSIKANIIDGFVRKMRYKMGRNREKTVTFFLADYSDQAPGHNPGFEYNDYLLLPFDEAYETLTFDNTKALLKEANEYLLNSILK